MIDPESSDRDPKLVRLMDRVRSGLTSEFELRDGTLWMGQRLCVPDVDELRREILEEAHVAAYAMHPGVTKMYNTLKLNFWWPGMKRQVTKFVSRCLTCQQVKAEHQASVGRLHSLPIPEWKWERITMDFIMGLPRTPRRYDTIWVIVDRLTKSAHFLPVRENNTLDQLAQNRFILACMGE
ncbi:hypothetical protein K2173_010398 [Erythroxylum novogranatense]|uniref:Integrase zinc-binding domain-containing protein n=1 Tax=Erythroxylum novogranatense TaxID=1862640 RepID=A0AAV8TFC1_9ROSI|nr:hypothetical protein K2173_010398 [Erythroxylum novogranatense]